MTTPAHAEEAVIGALLLDNMRLHDVAPLVSEAHFTDARRQRVFAAIRERILAGDPADTVTMGEALPDDFDYIIDLARSTFSAANCLAYAGVIRENWRRREAVSIGLRLSAAARAGEDGAVDEALRALTDLDSAVTSCEYTGKQAMRQAWEMVEKAYLTGGALPGITTGLSTLDDILGGWHDSDLSIVGARPAMGKTAFMGCVAEAAASAGKRPGIISAEQPAAQIALRRLSLLSNVPAAQLRAGKVGDEDWARMQAGMARAIEGETWIYDRSAITLDELVSVARKWKHRHGIGLLFIDYAQRIRVPGVERITEVATVARTLKDLARDLNIPVVALAQVKASVDTRNDKRPNQGDLANSDELTREADQILMLYRDAAYYHDKLPNGQPVPRGIAEIIVEKNRHGPTGFKKIAFREEVMQFADLTRGPDF